MALGLRFRSESILVTSGGTNYTVGASPITIVANSALVGVQRCGIYKFIINAIGASTVQFQDNSGNNLSGQYSLAALQVLLADTPINGDPWFMPAAAGVGVRLAIGGTGPVAADIWWAAGA